MNELTPFDDVVSQLCKKVMKGYDLALYREVENRRLREKVKAHKKANTDIKLYYQGLIEKYKTANIELNQKLSRVAFQLDEAKDAFKAELKSTWDQLNKERAVNAASQKPQAG